MNSPIKVTNISTHFGDTIIHDNISFEVKTGEIFGILGGSGAGKSTLLRQLILLQKFHSGDIEIFGKSFKNISIKDEFELRLRWAVLFQFGALFSSLTVLENICFPLIEYTKLPKKLIENIAMTKLNMVGLPSNCAHLYSGQLSGGMKKRVALARALALEPELLFLDEPTSGLDPASAEAFDKLIVKLRDVFNFSVVMVTHDLNTIKNALDRFIVLENKKIYFNGTYAEAINKNELFLNDYLKDN